MSEHIEQDLPALAADEVLAAAACPVVLTDGARRILACNSRGERALTSGRVVQRRNNLVVVADPELQQRFNQAHSLAVSGSRSTMIVRDGQGRLGNLITIARLSGGPRETRVAVLLAGPAVARQPNAELLRELLQVTGAEVQLISALCRGDTLRSYAEGRGLSLHTVRTQLRDIYRKTGLRSQLELVRVALSYVY